MNHNHSLVKGFRQGFLLSMFGAALVPSGHFSFYHSRINAITTSRDSLFTDLPDQRFVPLRKLHFVARITLRQSCLENLEGAFERQSIDINICIRRCFKHQRSNHEVPQRHRIKLLFQSICCFTAKVRCLLGATRVLVSFLLIKNISSSQHS